MTADCFKRRFLPFHPKLYRIAFALTENKEDAEDILQDAYCKLWNRREELTDVINPEAFAVTLVKNLCLDFLRSPRSRRMDGIPEEVVIVAEEAPPDKALEQQDELGLIGRLIEKLPEKQRQVIRLRGLNDCSLEEIGEITGFTAVNVRTLLSRARKAIKEQYEKVYEYER